MAGPSQLALRMRLRASLLGSSDCGTPRYFANWLPSFAALRGWTGYDYFINARSAGVQNAASSFPSRLFSPAPSDALILTSREVGSANAEWNRMLSISCSRIKVSLGQ